MDIMELATGIANSNPESAKKYSPYGRGAGIGNVSKANRAGIFGTEEEKHTHRRLKRAKKERPDHILPEDGFGKLSNWSVNVLELEQIPSSSSSS
jgi:hypothetical protein